MHRLTAPAALQRDCNGSCDIALARRQVGNQGVPGNARECAEMWERQAAIYHAELTALREKLAEVERERATHHCQACGLWYDGSGEDSCPACAQAETIADIERALSEAERENARLKDEVRERFQSAVRCVGIVQEEKSELCNRLTTAQARVAELEGQLGRLAKRADILDEAFTNQSAAIDALREHFDYCGHVKGNGEWRAREIAKHFTEAQAAWRSGVDRLAALAPAAPSAPEGATDATQ